MRFSQNSVADDLVSGRFSLSEQERCHVMDQLERILLSPLFGHSKRYSPFLRYVVEKTIAGETDTLKERTLGIEVFGRPLDYDSNNDPIVRVTAGEVRRRLAQYYYGPDHEGELRIELASGSYTAQFQLPKSVEGPHEVIAGTCPAPLLKEVTPDQSTKDNWLAGHIRLTWIRWFRLFSGVAFILFIAWYFVFARQQHTSTELAWGDILDNRSTTLIAVGGRSLNSSSNSTANPKWTIDQTSMSASSHMNADALSFSEARSLVHLVRILDDRKIQYSLRSVSETTFADLRQGPVILLGGLNNPWTLRAQQQLRYRLATDNNGLDWISDVRDPSSRKFFVNVKLPYSSLSADYAIVARFYDSNTQKPTLVVAGLAEDGTKAASEFITDEKQLQESVGESLRGSKGKNFEVVLGTQVINGVSGPPRVLAKEIW